MAKKPRKIRTNFRKNHDSRTRQKQVDLGRTLDDQQLEELGEPHSERVRAKGHLSRKRTVAGAEIVEDDSGTMVLPAIDESVCRKGRVLRCQGLVSVVQDDDGTLFDCATRKLLKTIATDQRHVVCAGDRVWFRVEGESEGIIERVEPRQGVISRSSRSRQHILVTNVDQIVIVASVAEPYLKPNLIDRFLISADKTKIEPIICINKIDLVETADLLPLVGGYGQLGYQVVMTSTVTGTGIEEMQRLMLDKETVVVGQSGVGKSSLLNAINPALGLRVQTVSRDTQKGRHTTTTAELIPLLDQDQGKPRGYVVDTPGIRQFQLWDVIAEEVSGYFREMRPYVSQCRFPDCTHTHEEECAVKDAVADGWIDGRRYESYAKIQSGE